MHRKHVQVTAWMSQVKVIFNNFVDIVELLEEKQKKQKNQRMHSKSD